MLRFQHYVVVVQRSLRKCLQFAVRCSRGVVLCSYLRLVLDNQPRLMMRGYFAPKRNHLHIAASSPRRRALSRKPQKATKVNSARSATSTIPSLSTSGLQPAPENTRQKNHRTSLQLHASVGVWILALVQFLGGILGLARPTIHYHLPHHRKN